MSEQPTDDLPVNDTGTHVLTEAPSGVLWECPLGYLETAKANGYTVVGAKVAEAHQQIGIPLFDPADHTVEQIDQHLAEAAENGDVDEIERVLAAEAAGKNRTSITDPTGTPPTDPNA